MSVGGTGSNGDGSDHNRRMGGTTVMMRVVLDHPPDVSDLHKLAVALRTTDKVMASPGFEVELTLLETNPLAVANQVLPRVQGALADRTIRSIQIDGEDIIETPE